MRILLYISFLLSCSQVFAQHTTAVYNNDSAIQIMRPYYSVSCPHLWTSDTSKLFGSDIFLRSPKADSNDQFIENLNVYVQNLQGHTYTLSKMGQEGEAQIRNIITDVDILESRLVSTASPNYYTLKYKGRQGKFMLLTEQHYYLKNDIGIAVTFTMQSDKENEYALVAKEVFQSFRLL